MSATTMEDQQHASSKKEEIEEQNLTKQKELLSKPMIPTVYPPNQPTIIIGPNSIRAVPNPGSQGQNVYLSAQQIYPSLGSSFNRRLRDSFMNDKSMKGHHSSLMTVEGMGSALNQDLYSRQNYNDDEDDDEEDDLRVGGFFNDMDFFTWDLIIKDTPKLPQLELLFHKNQLKNKKFFTIYNDYQYNPPFMIFYPKKNYKEDQVPQELYIGNFQEYLGIPHQCELMKFFENFHLMKYPKEPILMLKRKFFMVQYEIEVLHAMDGLGMGVIIIPVNGNFLIKVYDQSYTPNGSTVAENFTNIIKPLMELAAVFLKC